MTYHNCPNHNNHNCPNDGLAQVVEMSVTNNSLSKGYPHPEDHDKPITMTYIALHTKKKLHLCCTCFKLIQLYSTTLD